MDEVWWDVKLWNCNEDGPILTLPTWVFVLPGDPQSPLCNHSPTLQRSLWRWRSLHQRKEVKRGIWWTCSELPWTNQLMPCITQAGSRFWRSRTCTASLGAQRWVVKGSFNMWNIWKGGSQVSDKVMIYGTITSSTMHASIYWFCWYLLITIGQLCDIHKDIRFVWVGSV